MSSENEAADALSNAIADYQAAVDDFDRAGARALGVNETDLRCLEILMRERGQATPRMLADRLGVTSGSVTTMLDRLSKMSLIERNAHSSDRRKVIVTATPEAIRRAGDLIGPLIADGHELLRTYDVEQLGLITDFLVRATDLQHRHTERLRQAADDGRGEP